MKNNRTENKKYSYISNVAYICCMIFRYDSFFFIIMIFHILMQAALPVWFVVIPKIILSSLILQVTARELMRVLLGIGLCSVILQSGASFFSRKYESKIGLLRTNCFRIILINKLFRVRYSQLEDPDVQELINRAWMVSWSNNFGVEGFLRKITMVIGSIFSLLGFSAILLDLSPWLPLLLLVFVGIDLIIIRRNKSIELIQREKNGKLDRQISYLNSTMQDFSYGKDIRVMGLGNVLLSWHRRVMMLRQKSIAYIQRKYAMGDFMHVLVAMFRGSVIYGYLINSVLNHGESIANFTMYFAAIASFSSVMINMVENYETARQYAQCINDMRKLMDLPEHTGFLNSKADVDLTKGITIELDHVCYRYPGAHSDTIHDVCYTFRTGECIAIVGENGSGKTTLVKLLTGLLQPTSGCIRLCGKDVSTLGDTQRFALFGVVFQDIYQYAFTLGENIAFKEGYDRKLVEEALCKTELSSNRWPKGLDTMLRRDFDPEGIDLSGGQAQNMAIARGLYKEGGFLIMDEPTAALDPIAEEKIYSKLHDLTEGRAAVYISHRLASTRFCHQIILLRNGAIIDHGTHEELLRKNMHYAEMFNAQSQYYKMSEEFSMEGEAYHGKMGR